jgi:transposase
MRYRQLEPNGSSALVVRTMMRYALERESDRGSTFAVLSSYQKEEMSVADLCRAYGISRPTAYRWINRYNKTGPEGLVDRSRRPHSCSHATLEPIENAIFVLRAKHPSWGARKLKARLEMLQPEVVWPAVSTFGNIVRHSEDGEAGALISVYFCSQLKTAKKALADGGSGEFVAGGMACNLFNSFWKSFSS